jgi:hypothetical protein
MAAAIGVIVTVIKFWSKLRLAREQRDRELRWRQAQAGKELNDDMPDDPLTWPALQMLDYSGREFELPSKKRTMITHGDVRHSLNPQKTVTEERHIHIRDCFDSLFYYMAMFDLVRGRLRAAAQGRRQGEVALRQRRPGLRARVGTGGHRC